MNDFIDVVVVGSINQDYLIKTKSIPGPGETVTGATLDLQPGGKGANQAVAAASLGARVSMIGAVGDDFIGDMLIESLNKSNIDTTMVKKLKSSTSGSAFVTITPDGENSIIVASGANWGIEISHIEQAKQTIALAKVLLLQMELPISIVEYAISQAGINTLVVLNLAPAGKINLETLKRVNVLVLNEHEASFLAKKPVSDLQSAKQVGQKLLDLGMENIIITLGQLGALMLGEQNLYVPAPRVQVLDTTGAGDCFVGVLASRLSQGITLSKALHQATKAASLSVQILGAQASFPTLDQIDN